MAMEAELAQTRADDDLFADEIEIIAVNESSLDQFIPRGPRARAGHRGQGPRGRGLRGSVPRSGHVVHNHLSDSLRQAGQEPQSPDAPIDDPVNGIGATTKEQPVVGDRSATGGVKKERLTDEALTARLAEMKIKSQAREAAYVKSQQDAATFQQREQDMNRKNELQQKYSKEQKQSRQQYAQRKMEAQQLRAWDVEKTEADFRKKNDGEKGNFIKTADGVLPRGMLRKPEIPTADAKDGSRVEGLLEGRTGHGYGLRAGDRAGRGRGYNSFEELGGRGRGSRPRGRGRVRGSGLATDRATKSGHTMGNNDRDHQDRGWYDDAFPALASGQDHRRQKRTNLQRTNPDGQTGQEGWDAPRGLHQIPPDFTQRAPELSGDWDVQEGRQMNMNEKVQRFLDNIDVPEVSPPGATNETWADRMEEVNT